MLATCLPRLTEAEGALARKLAAAILDEAKVAELDADPAWAVVEAIPVHVPWHDDPVAGG